MLDPEFATYKNLPEGSTAIEIGLVPVANGDAKATVNVPLLASIAMPETVFELKLAT